MVIRITACQVKCQTSMCLLQIALDTIGTSADMHTSPTKYLVSNKDEEKHLYPVNGEKNSGFCLLKGNCGHHVHMMIYPAHRLNCWYTTPINNGIDLSGSGTINQWTINDAALSSRTTSATSRRVTARRIPTLGHHWANLLLLQYQWYIGRRWYYSFINIAGPFQHYYWVICVTKNVLEFWRYSA